MKMDAVNGNRYRRYYHWRFHAVLNRTGVKEDTSTVCIVLHILIILKLKKGKKDNAIRIRKKITRQKEKIKIWTTPDQ